MSSELFNRFSNLSINIPDKELIIHVKSLSQSDRDIMIPIANTEPLLKTEIQWEILKRRCKMDNVDDVKIISVIYMWILTKDDK